MEEKHWDWDEGYNYLLGIETTWEIFKKFPNESINQIKITLSGVPSTPELLEILAKVLMPTSSGFGKPKPININHDGVAGVVATFENGQTSEKAGRPLPSESEAVAAGIMKKSHYTHRYGVIDKYSGTAILTMPDGRRFQAIGVSRKGDAWTAYQGEIFFNPIIRKEKLQLEEATPLKWGGALLSVFCDQYGNRYAFHEGAAKPHVFVPFWHKEWREGKASRAIFWEDRKWLGDEGFCVNIPKGMLTQKELLFLKYTQEGALPKVEAL